MNRRRFVLTAAILNVNARLGTVSAETKTGLVGTWRIVSYEDRGADGNTSYPYGKRPIGVLTYDATGHMSVQITKAPSNGERRRAGPHSPGTEKAESVYTAYFGTYAVDWESRVITHKVEGNLYPVFVGTKHERPFDLDGDRLVLKPRWVQDGKTYIGTRVFERMS